MVFTTAVLEGVMLGPARFWKIRRVKRLTSHMYGRRRNCFKVALVALRHSLRDATRGRWYRRRDLNELRILRIDSAANEHGISGRTLYEGVQRNLILLNKKILADLAIWEPRTFKALTDIAKVRSLVEEDLPSDKIEKDDFSHIYCKRFLQQ